MASAPGLKAGGGGKGGDDTGLQDGMGDFTKVFDKLESQMEKLTKMEDAAEKGAGPKAIKAMMDELKKISKMFDGIEDAGKTLSKFLE